MTDDAALERVLGMPAQDFAEAAARLAEAPRDRSLSPWRQDGPRWIRDATCMNVVADVIDETTCSVFVRRFDGSLLPIVEARNPAEGRYIADVLLAGLGWEVRA